MATLFTVLVWPLRTGMGGWGWAGQTVLITEHPYGELGLHNLQLLDEASDQRISNFLKKKLLINTSAN